MVFRVVAEVELREDRPYVGLHGLRAHVQLAGDRRIRSALSHQCEHFTLAVAETRDGIVRARRRPQLFRDQRVDDSPTGRDRAARVDELVELGNSLLQEVADALARTISLVAP